MDIRQLKSFIVLAEMLHFGQAARRLHISQPPLSRQIASIESELGTPLFSRSSRSVQLTPAGEVFYHHAQNILLDLEAAVHAARATARGEQGSLRVGFTMYAAWNVLPGLIKCYSNAFPSVAVDLEETLPRNMQQALERGNIDVGIGFQLTAPHDLSSRILLREPLCAVLPQGHPLSNTKQISVSELACERFVTFPKKTAPVLHDAVMDTCRKNGFEPDIQLETHLQQTIVNLVAEGLGIALVPDSMRRLKLEGAVFRPLVQSEEIEQRLYWHNENTNPCLSGFLATIPDATPIPSNR